MRIPQIESRADTLCRMYGEVVTKAQAGRILDCAPSTIRAMLTDGRLTEACQGSRVDTRSIAAYIEAPQQMNEQARLERKRRRMGIECRWHV